jgi:hypothetical protein
LFGEIADDVCRGAQATQAIDDLERVDEGMIVAGREVGRLVRERRAAQVPQESGIVRVGAIVLGEPESAGQPRRQEARAQARLHRHAGREVRYERERAEEIREPWSGV